MKLIPQVGIVAPVYLSVSSNGSLWVKLKRVRCEDDGTLTFSILERIVMGETSGWNAGFERNGPFSILERIVMGETGRAQRYGQRDGAFQYPRTDRYG